MKQLFMPKQLGKEPQYNHTFKYINLDHFSCIFAVETEEEEEKECELTSNETPFGRQTNIPILKPYPSNIA